MVVKLWAQLFNCLSYQPEVHHHAAARIGLACEGDFGAVSVAVDAAAAVSLYLAIESMGSIEKNF